MKNFILYDEGGEIKATGACEDNEVDIQARLGLKVLEVPNYISCNEGYVLDNKYVPFTTEQKISKENRPYYLSKWDNTSMSWEDLRSTQEKLTRQWMEIKSQREIFLQQSDWRVAKATDTGIPLSQNWKDYRQALRDITLQSDPFNITWPVPPA
jgi:hypothetical protein